MSKIYTLATGLIAALSTVIITVLLTATDISFADQKFKRVWLPVQIAGDKFKSGRAYIKFDQNGLFDGNAGCNKLNGKFSINGNKIEFANISTTLVGCIDPEIMKQEEMFVQLLTEVTKFTRNGKMLMLTDDEGTVKARLVELGSLLIRTAG